MKTQLHFLLITLIITNYITAQVTIVKPNGAEVWNAGSTQTISWTVLGGSNGTMDLEYSIDSGATWSVIANNKPYFTGTHTWIVPSTPSTRCLVRLYMLASGTLDESDSVFTIHNPTAGIAENTSVPFSIYPNPAINDLYIYKNFSQEISSLKIFNNVGSLVSNTIQLQEISANTLYIPIADLSAGIYFVELRTEAYSERKKLIIAK